MRSQRVGEKIHWLVFVKNDGVEWTKALVSNTNNL